ncbi:TrkA-C domain-containing protein [Halopenitus malekzadehii]|uniref:TrkA-C domain-containing protein n=1 Tax=Halopenitus malekzadehii TaxID=1267564 RepID=A0A1H6HMI0_9EURY|nr:SLC13 family permease [Halopenitus malekzadehii]SEH37009.1 TrkA-C domain-containing protein [Halopenitus malekzadehii]
MVPDSVLNVPDALAVLTAHDAHDAPEVTMTVSAAPTGLELPPAALDAAAIVEVSGATVVFGLILAALVLFVTEAIPNDVTAIGVMAALVLLEPWTGVDARGAISGFANPATVTIIAMYMLSAGIQATGLVRRLGVHLADLTAGSEFRALVATVCTAGPLAGFINNTPVVAVFVPMITDLAAETRISPSKLLLPLSYAAILGGTLTVIGTSTNILASDFARILIDGRDGIGMFEFTGLGVVVLGVGTVYLLTVGRRLVPARVPVDADPIDEFDLDDHLAMMRVRSDSPVIGRSIDTLDADVPDVRILQLRRNGSARSGPDSAEPIRAEDRLVVHGTLQAINRFREATDLAQLVREDVTEETFETAETDGTLARAIVPEGSRYIGETIAETGLSEYHRTTVLAVRRAGELHRSGLSALQLQAGDLLLVRTTPPSIRYFTDTGDLLVAEETAVERLASADPADIAPISDTAPVAVAIMVGVVGIAALGALPIVIAALAGVFAMVVTGCLRPADAYDAVSWNVVFLLAGVIPLGLAMDRTGGAAMLSELLVATAQVLPPIGVLFLFTVVTALLANVITPVATVVLMIPVAVDAAVGFGANPFAFLLAVTFASATSFMTPVGYQTNLMVYGPGGYRFSDFLRVGGPLQLLVAVVTTVGIVVGWGL